MERKGDEVPTQAALQQFHVTNFESIVSRNMPLVDGRSKVCGFAYLRRK